MYSVYYILKTNLYNQKEAFYAEKTCVQWCKCYFEKYSYRLQSFSKMYYSLLYVFFYYYYCTKAKSNDMNVYNPQNKINSHNSVIGALTALGLIYFNSESRYFYFNLLF